MAEEAILVKGEDSILLKKAIAKALYSRNIDQPKISNILKISQPMVSNYCSSVDKIPKKILELSEIISEKIINDNPVTFNLCASFSEKSLEGNFYIASKNEIISDEKTKIVDNMTHAFLLLKGKNMGGLIPEVKINIAMAKENAKDPEDVAAFLNGLILVDDKVTSNNGIRFGKSRHLSNLLIYLKEKVDIRAIMNVAYSENIKKTSFSFSYLTKNFKLNETKKDIDILLHKGDFGIEPCAYIIGKDAVDIVNKIIRLKEELI